jgi:hypothetical protein
MGLMLSFYIYPHTVFCLMFIKQSHVSDAKRLFFVYRIKMQSCEQINIKMKTHDQ